MTKYIVLKRFQTPVAGWEIIGSGDASGPQVARKAVDKGEGEFLVVPVRNATFISGSIVQAEPKVVSVEVAAETYLQEPFPLGDAEPVVPDADA